MKIGKKAVMGISFMVGTIMFATTAFAEVSTKSGYEQAKDALKYTADSLNSKLQNYTVNTSIIVKDNGDIISEKDYINKYDLSKDAIENTSTDSESNKPKLISHYYRDKKTVINEVSTDNIYNVTNFTKETKFEAFGNPFKGKQVSDVERIIDAAVGELKDSVVVSPKDNGTKELSGNISESQIPAIANAIVSYEVKSKYSSDNSNNSNNSNSIFPNNISDVYVKNASGDMILNKDGLILSGLGSAEITCKDKEGKVHNLNFEIVGKIVDINTTRINKPDLNGKKVNVSSNQADNNKLSDPQSYVGSYKNDIVIKKDGKFQKIGERIVDLTSVDDKKIIGRYHEEYIKGYESYASDIKNTNFTASVKDAFNANFEITDSKGNKIKGNMGVNSNSATINFGFDNVQSQDTSYNYEYSRVFN